MKTPIAVLNRPKQVVIVLIGLIALLAGYGVCATAKVGRLEKRVNGLETSCRELQTRHRAFATTMLHADDSLESAARAKVEMLRESLGVPAPTALETGPIATEINSMPREVRNK